MSALPVSGQRNPGLKGKMETNYQNKQVKEQINQLETLIPSAYRNDLDIKDKEKLLKEIYYSIDLFNRLVYEAKYNTKR